MVFANIIFAAFPLPTLPRKTGEECDGYVPRKTGEECEGCVPGVTGEDLKVGP